MEHSDGKFDGKMDIEFGIEFVIGILMVIAMKECKDEFYRLVQPRTES